MRRGTTVSVLKKPLLLLVLATFVLSGCGHYQLGRDAKPPFRSVYVEPVVNESFAPQAQALLTTQIREALIHDGLLEVRGKGEADAVLTVVLKNFEREVAATRTDDTGLAEKLRLDLAAEITLSDRRSGETYMLRRNVSATADAFPEESATRAEYQSMPVLTHNLARRIAYEVLQVW